MSDKDKKRKKDIAFQVTDGLKDTDLVVINYTTDFNETINGKPTVIIKLAHKIKKS